MKRCATAVIFLVLLLASSAAGAHCQIPCGIYDDDIRFRMMREDVNTIEKSMREIKKLSGQPSKNSNQIVRWVNNKDHHAEKIEDIVSYYFLAQRVKPIAKGKDGYNRYAQQVTTLHNIIIQAMKAKQTTDLNHIKNLRSLIQKFEHLYFGK